MRRLLGIPLLVLAGCATQSDGGSPASPKDTLEAVAPLPPKGWLTARIGVEYLASEPDQELLTLASAGLGHASQDRPTPRRSLSEVESTRPEPTARPADPRESVGPEQSELPWLSRDALARIENPAERFTLNFIHHMIGEDRRRVQRQVGAPILFNQLRNSLPVHGLETVLDQRNREDQALLLARERSSLLNRPLRRALKTSTLIHRFETLIDDFKADHVPLTGAYEDQHQRRRYGRFSVRLHVRDSANPVEVAYRYEGWRVGTAHDYMKFGLDRDLSENVAFSMRGVYQYGPALLDMWCALRVDVDESTNAHLLFSDKMDIVTGSTMYPVVHSPVALRTVDESPGALFYMEHFF